MISYRASAYALCTAIFLGLAASPAQATVINPAPGSFGSDDGTMVFTPGSSLFATDIFTTGNISAFGFYYANAPGTLIQLFDASAVANQIADAIFATGRVVNPATSMVTNTFTPGTGPIGFYVQTSVPGAPTLFSQPSLDGGPDFVASFPSLSSSTDYLLGFGYPATGQSTALAYYAITPVTAVPESSSLSDATAMLLIAGCTTLVFNARSRGRRARRG